MTGEKSLFLDESACAFFRELVEELDAEKELRFGVVQLDQRPIAIHFGFRYDGRMIWYKPSFDIDWWEYSPGEVLLRSLFEYVDSEGLDEFDFTVGDEAFKHRFANEVRENYDLYLFRGGRGKLIQFGNRVKDRAKRFPKLWSLAKQSAHAARGLVVESRRVFAQHGLFGVSKKIVRMLFRRWVYAVDEVLVFASSQEAPDQDDNLTVVQGKLSNLAALSVRHPDVFDAAKLEKARNRLKEGAQVNLTYLDDKIVHVAWTNPSDVISDKGQVGAECRVTLDTPGSVIFDCWTDPTMRGQGIYPRTLNSLIQQTANNGYRSWIYCRSDNVPSLRGIEKAGFIMKFRMQRKRWFGRVTHSSVLPHGNNE